MRTIVISNMSRTLLDGHIVGRAVKIERQLADTSWEASVDDDMGHAIDCLCGDPDKAFQMLCKPSRDACQRCGAELDVDWCWTCKRLVF